MVFYSKFYVPQLKRSFFIAKDEHGICLIELGDNENKFLKKLNLHLGNDILDSGPVIKNNKELFYEVSQIKEYFAGLRKNFSLQVHLKGSAFRLSAWQALAETDYGETISYSQLASLAGNKNAVRAAATACAVNPVPIIIPCHRVIAKNGSIGGFGGGLDMKRYMLNLELKNKQ